MVRRASGDSPSHFQSLFDIFSPSPQPRSTMPVDRSVGRNVHLYGAKNRDTSLGGLILTNGVTKTNFYSMVEILLLCQSSFFIEDESSAELERNEEPLAVPCGNYYVVGKEASNW